MRATFALRKTLSSFSQQKRNFASLKVDQKSANVVNGTLGQVFADKVARFQHRDAVYTVSNEKTMRWTYIETQKEVDAFGDAFLVSRIRPNQNFVSVLETDPENFISHIATANLGVNYVSVPGNTPSEELFRTIDNVKPFGFIFNPRLLDFAALQKELPETTNWTWGMQIRLARFPFLKTLIHTQDQYVPGVYNLRDIIDRNLIQSEVPNYSSKVKPTDIAYSIVQPNTQEIHSYDHTQIAQSASFFADFLGISAGERIAMSLPYSTLAGKVLGIWAPLLNGAVTVIPSVSGVDQLVKTVFDKEQCTTLFASVSQLQSILSYEKLAHLPFKLKKVVIVNDNYTPVAELQQIRAALTKLNVSKVGVVYASEGLFVDLGDSNSGSFALPGSELRTGDDGSLRVRGPTTPRSVTGSKKLDNDKFLSSPLKVKLASKSFSLL